MRAIFSGFLCLVIVWTTSCRMPLPGSTLQEKEGVGTGNGIVSSGGADEPEYEADSAWFMGAGKVDCCVEVGPTFPVQDAALLARKVESAFGLWHRYVDERRLLPPEIFATVGDFAKELTCSASCRDKAAPDLRVLFGVTNEQVTRDLTNFRRPWAFAKKLPRQAGDAYHKGYIWVNDRLYEPDQTLDGLIMHEMGHAFGFSHVSGTIMRADLIDYLFGSAHYFGHKPAPKLPIAEKLLAADFLGLIDDERELVVPSTGAPVTYQGHFGDTLESASANLKVLNLPNAQPDTLTTATIDRNRVLIQVPGQDGKGLDVAIDSRVDLSRGEFWQVYGNVMGDEKAIKDGLAAKVILQQRTVVMTGRAVIAGQPRPVLILQSAEPHYQALPIARLVVAVRGDQNNVFNPLFVSRGTRPIAAARR